MMQVDFGAEWRILCAQMDRVFGVSTAEGMAVHNSVYRLCTAVPPLHQRLYAELTKYAHRHAQKVASRIAATAAGSAVPAATLVAYAKEWKSFAFSTNSVNSLFRYFNQHRDPEQNKRSPLRQLRTGHGKQRIPAPGLQHSDMLEFAQLFTNVWNEEVFDALHQTLAEQATLLLREHRMQNPLLDSVDVVGVLLEYVNSVLLVGKSRNSRDTVMMYKLEVEQPIIAETKKFYAEHLAKVLESSGVQQFVKAALDLRESDLSTTKRFLHVSSVPEYEAALNTVFATAYIRPVCAECPHYLQQEEFDYLRRAYMLMTFSTDGVGVLFEAFQEYLTMEAEKITAAIAEKNTGTPESSVLVVDALIEFKKRLVRTAERGFDACPLFLSAIDKGLHDVAAKIRVLSNHLAAYFHLVISRSACPPSKAAPSFAALSPEDRERVLLDLSDVLKYVPDKDVFMEASKKFLCKRLLGAKSVDLECETLLINKVQEICGFVVAGHLQKMFGDYVTSSERSEKLREFCQDRGRQLPPIDFGSMIVTASMWPIAQKAVDECAVVYPPRVKTCIDEMTAFYTATHGSRRLAWLLSQGTAEVDSLCTPVKYRYTVTCTQALVLDSMNKRDAVTMSDVMTATGLPQSWASAILESFVQRKMVLMDGGLYRPNTQFVLKKAPANKRVTVPPPKFAAETEDTEMEASSKAREDEEQRIETARKFELQAIVTRIMKARREMAHTQLVQETITLAQARFRPTVPMVKRTIEYLIEKEYIARKLGTNDHYVYLA